MTLVKYLERSKAMFVARRIEELPESVSDAGKAEGMIHLCDQSALVFGSNRRKPTAYRPVVAVRSEGQRVVVLPCTSKDNTGSPDFFELNAERVMWTRPDDGRKSFANYRYEMVPAHRLRGKIGVMPQPARIELLVWLKSRY